VRWVAVDRLPELEFPAANQPIIQALRLPDRYLITPEPGDDLDHFLDGLRHSLAPGGLRLVQLRAKRLSGDRLQALAGEALTLCRRFDAQLLVNADPEVVERIGADGVHLSGERLHRLDRRPLPRSSWVAASCHGIGDLHQARRIGVDFVVLGPVGETPTHPGSQTMGWEAFGSLCDEASMPVYALGGMGPDDIPEARSRGGQGIAAIRALWRP
jgi:8-oxo-dGTP diphosphatase